MNTRELFDQYVLPTYGRFDLTIVRGDGCRVWSEDGRELIDFGAGIAVCSLGHAHPRVTETIAMQAATLVHCSNLYRTVPQAILAERLVRIVGAPGKVFFCNSGAEANEGLIKLARRFGSPTGRHGIITMNGSFHGRTMAGISATGQEKVKIGFAPLLDGFTHVPPNDLDAVRGAIDSNTCAILLEPIQGEGGIHLARPDFLRGLQKLCDEHRLLLLFDEVQCGLGRTGDWCGWKSIVPEGVSPDGVSWAKGIANGFPLGAFWVSDRAVDDRGALSSLLGPGSHGTTYGGNPVACVAGLAVIDEIEEGGLLSNARGCGEYFVSRLLELNLETIAEVRALGLMIGVELTADVKERIGCGEDGRVPSIVVTDRLMQAGLLVIPAGEKTIRFLPPLNITRDQIDRALEVLCNVLR